MLPHGLYDRPQPRCLAFEQHRRLDELRLPSLAMGWDDEPTRHLVRDTRTEVPPHDVKAKIDPGGAPRRRQHLPLVDIEDVGIELDVRMASRDGGTVAPMRGGAEAAQQPRRRKDRDPGTERHDPGAASVSRDQGDHEAVRHRRVDAAPARHHDQVGLREHLESVFDRHHEAARGPEGSGFDAANRVAVPSGSDFRSRQAEDFRDRPELERTKSVIGQHGDAWTRQWTRKG